MIQTIPNATRNTRQRAEVLALHHHHLVCRHCGTTVEVSGPAVERWADKVATEHAFTEVAHTLEIFGRCGDCAP